MNIFRPRRQLPIADRKAPKAFTILEVMIAIGIFAMILTAIYATWTSILKGSRAGLNAAAAVQRSRIAIRSIEDAFLTVQLFNENLRYYAFVADTEGDMAAVSMVSRLPASFPGVARYGDQVVRRISFYVRPGADGGYELMMTHAPMLLATNSPGVEPAALVLAKDVSEFRLEFLDLQKKEWVDEWLYTNQLPRLVSVTLGLGKVGNSSQPQDLVTRIIAIPASAVAGVQMGTQPPPPPPPPP
jgi:prepilin-type N-terminal cleavage/methylation domain-containing protein